MQYLLYLTRTTVDTQEIVAKRIRLARVERDLKQSQLADLIGTDQRYVSRIESGEINIGVETVARVARALKKSVEYFFEPFEDGAEVQEETKREDSGRTRRPKDKRLR